MNDASKFVFEISWEVVNKVGGIHTVIRTKADETVAELGSSYYMLGPLNPHEAITEVDRNVPSVQSIDFCIEEMRRHGVKIWTGNWLIPGNPNVILFDVKSGYGMIDGWRHEFHHLTSIPIHVFDEEVSDCLVFGGLVSWFLSCLKNRIGQGKLILAHFHEWIASVGLIFLRCRNVDVSLIFTTHATLMGRHLASGSCDLYNNLSTFDCDLEAGNRGFYTNHCIERCAAHKAHVFTSVSNVTAEEAEVFLGRKPDIITPNGLSIKKYGAQHEFQNLHIVCKELIHEFVRGHFFGSYYFDLDKTIYLFSAGRYEFTNKGVDILLESAYRLNNILKARNIDVTVVLFLIFNARTNNLNVESLKNQAMVRQLRQSVEKIQALIGTRIFESVVSGRLPDPKDLLLPKEITDFKKFIHFSRTGSTLPPIVTHNMVDDAQDPVLCALRRLKLFNYMDDKLKVVFHPQFLQSTSPLFPIEYDSFVRGCHMGAFPSYYEPWGYTPAECTIMGIPSLTTNLSGFGQFMDEHITHPADYGVYIVDRRSKSVEESITQMTNFYTKTRLLAIERTHPDKLRYFSKPDDASISFQKLGRSISFSSPRVSSPCSEDENNHTGRVKPNPEVKK
ncbi:Glycogen [starch] synthase, muscle [Thelohanellus kitauei]|uniref:Glycogen [starch] synthase n=1 Tax=Thelohanellus kitauei TaxID=669202 RepID=A0A0C2IAE5_THEKT|nr:Glycogen [starch] synthase, muscle [Thelohanellus kitauei]